MALRKSFYTVKELADRWGVSERQVCKLITGGLLRAVNVSGTRGGRPTYRVAPDVVQAYESRKPVVRTIKVLTAPVADEDGVIAGPQLVASRDHSGMRDLGFLN